MQRPWKKLYKSYGKQYNKTKRKSSVTLESKYSYEEFIYIYQAKYNSELERRNGGRVANVTRSLINDQKSYDYTTPQAKSFQTALQNRMNADDNKFVSINDIRKGNATTLLEDLFNELNIAYANGQNVGQIFFGSA